jgi:hypothetical protein
MQNFISQLACRSSVSANLAIEKIKKEIPNAKGTQSCDA